MSFIRAESDRYHLHPCRRAIRLINGKREDGVASYKRKLAVAHERSPPLK